MLEMLGVKVDLTAEQMSRCLAKAGIAFLFAPAVHPAMAHAADARRQMKMRTVFNLLGPLANPAGAQHQLIGAPNFEAARIMAQALSLLGTTKSIIAHGEDGLDEITTTGRSMVYEVVGSAITRKAMKPDDFGVPPASIEELHAETGEDSARAITAILNVELGPKMDIVMVNAGAALYAAGRAETVRDGVSQAFSAIVSGAAREKLDAL